MEVWEISSGRQQRFAMESTWNAFSFHPTAPRILCPSFENQIVLYDLETGRELKRFSATGSVQHVEFSPDGQFFIAQHRVGGRSRQKGAEWYTSLFNADTGATVSSTLTGWIDGLAWHPEGRLVAFALRSGDVHLHDRKTGQTRVLGRHKSEARTAVFSPDGAFLFTGGEEQEIICWDLRSFQRAFSISLQSPSLQFRADGQQCAVINKTGLLLHSFERAVPYREMRGELGSGVIRGAISADGHWLAVGGTDRLALWDLTRDGPATTVRDLFNPPTPVFSSDSSELLFFWREGITRWRMAPGGEPGVAPEVTSLPIYNPGPLLSVGFSGDNLVFGTTEGVVLVSRANIASGPGERHILGGARGKISPNGLWVAVPKWIPPRQLVCRLNPWQDIMFLEVDADPLAESFTPRSDELAIATYTSVTFLDTNLWKPQRRFTVSLDRNAQIIFMPDGKAFWLVHDARNAALHDTHTFETLARLPPGTIPLAVSADGRHLAVSVDARRVQVWDLEEAGSQLRGLGLSWHKDSPTGL